MTSSLVGSEMCIRDSICLTYTMRDHDEQSIATRWQLPVLFSICLMHAPVSYTHLTLPTICSV
eukprot:4180059-Prorocentrum_lima.AAC.1